MSKISEYAELVTPTDDDLLITVNAGVTKKIKRANFLGKTLNYIGIAGTAGFGVGICPNTLPAGMLALPGYDVIGNDQYGNYQYSDGSIMVWVPKFYYKVLHDGSTNINKVLIASVYDYENETAANTAGYALHRAFIDGGVIKDGFFIDKYKWSLTGFVLSTSGIASSIKNGNPIASDAALRRDRAITITNATASGAEVTVTATSHGLTVGTPSAMTLVISGVVGMTDLNGTKTVIRITDANTIVVSLTTAQTYTSGGTATTTNFPGAFSSCRSNSQTPTDTYGGAWAAAKSRGSNFAVWSMFIRSAINLLAHAHGQAAVSTTNCAWYLTNKNYPKGANNYGADIDDATCTFTACDDAYWATRNEARKTGSGTAFAKTTHNGQNCGVADLQGDQWQIAQGLTAIVTTVNVSGTADVGGTAIEVTTAAAHGLTTNDWVMLTAVGGTTILNDKIWKVTVTAADKFTVVSGSHAAWTSGGVVTKGKFYALKESVAIKDVTGGNSVTSSDHFNDTFILANFDEVIPNFANGGAFAQKYGNSTNQVIPFNTSRTNANYKLSALGLPDTSGMSTGGTNLFGLDYYYQYLRDELCPVLGGGWGNSTSAGVWDVDLSGLRAGSGRSVSARACLYV